MTYFMRGSMANSTPAFNNDLKVEANNDLSNLFSSSPLTNDNMTSNKSTDFLIFSHPKPITQLNALIPSATRGIESVTFINCEIACSNFSKCNSVKRYTFRKCKFLGRSLYGMFRGNCKVESVRFIDCNFSGIEDMRRMFQDCVNLEEVTFMHCKWCDDLEFISHMFAYCFNLERVIIDNLNVRYVRCLHKLFYKCRSLREVPDCMKSWKTQNVKYMSRMFMYCTRLRSLEALENWDTRNAEDMSEMFMYCKGLRSLKGLERWDVSKVMNMRDLFNGCSGIVTLRSLYCWNVMNVINMSGCFRECKKLLNLIGLERWNVSNVRVVEFMFHMCEELRSIEEIGNWNFQNVRSESEMIIGSCVKDVIVLKDGRVKVF